MTDQHQRKIDYMRLSVTDQCNFRCLYCMPEVDNTFIPPADRLTLNDIRNLGHAMRKLGITKVKITGGEPLVRKDIVNIVDCLKNECNFSHISLTTNGALLPELLDPLIAAGLDSVTISIDTIDQHKFNTLTRRASYDQVKLAIEMASRCQIKDKVKLNAVALTKFGPDNIIELTNFANKLGITVRFIEMMPIGLGRLHSGINLADTLAALTEAFGQPTLSTTSHGNGPAKYYTFPHLTTDVGVISALSSKFCEGCNKIRITSNGHLKQCLHYNRNIDLIELINKSDGLEQIADFIYQKPQAHAFGEDSELQLENKKMSDIGG